jgi:hypothetical protein
MLNISIKMEDSEIFVKCPLLQWVKPIEMKKGDIIIHEGKSYFILDSNEYFEGDHGDPEYYADWQILRLKFKKVECRYCEGNLFKRGTKKGQYLCSECNRPNWLDSEGNHEEA